MGTKNGKNFLSMLYSHHNEEFRFVFVSLFYHNAIFKSIVFVPIFRFFRLSVPDEKRDKQERADRWEPRERSIVKGLPRLQFLARKAFRVL